MPISNGMEKVEIEKKIKEVEEQMNSADFWVDKEKAKSAIKEYQDLKDALSGVGKYDKGDAVMTIFSGAGGVDAEDFARMLFQMYSKYLDNKKWAYKILHENENDHGGVRNITIEISQPSRKAMAGEAGPYGTLKNESGVHRLVRISPFNAKNLRHTSFAMVEVIPKFEKTGEIEISEDDLKIEFARSSGPGGQNVNKRETAVRIVHIPTNISAHVDGERSQAQNKEKALEVLRGKLYYKMEEERKRTEKGMQISSTTDAEWGNQIRSYVLHPYKMVKDHRTGVEIRNTEEVLDGNLEAFIEAEKNI